MARIFIRYRHVEPHESIARFLSRHLSDTHPDVFFDRDALKAQPQKFSLTFYRYLPKMAI